jgi:hypothetical protein
MSYDNPAHRATYTRFFDFGGSSGVVKFHILGPKGKAGRIYDYGVVGVEEVFNGGTITPKISVGTDSDADYYGDEIVLHGVAVASGGKSLRNTYREDEAGFDTTLLIPQVAADAVVCMHFVEATGSPTGQATAFVTIDWDP